MMYEKGVGVERDAAEAAKWRELSEKGSGASPPTS